MIGGRRSIKEVNISDVEKRKSPGKHYVYIIAVTWSDGDISIIYRRYSKFFDFQVKLLDSFPKEAGKHNPVDRIIPFIPGKIIFGRSHIKQVALKRLEPINEYCKQLVQLPERISQSQHVLDFFTTRDEDLLPNNNTESHDPVKGHEISEPVLLDQCQVVTDFTKGGANETDLVAGEVVDIVEKSETGWWFVSGVEGQGWVPSSYLEPLDGQLDTRLVESNNDIDRPYLATRSYVPQQSDELAMELGSVITVLEKNMDGWWLVSANGHEGHVPATYLTRSDTVRARHILTALNKTTEDSSNGRGQRKAPPLPTGKRPGLAELTVPPMSQPKEESPLVNRKPPPPRRGTIQRTIPRNTEPPEEPVYMTVADFQNQAGDGISFKEGEKVEVFDKTDSGWWYVTIGTARGWAPSAYIHKTQPPPQPSTSTSQAAAKKMPGASFANELQQRLFNKATTSKTEVKPASNSTQQAPRKKLPTPEESKQKPKPLVPQNTNTRHEWSDDDWENESERNSSVDDYMEMVENQPIYANDDHDQPPPLPAKGPVARNGGKRPPITSPRMGRKNVENGPKMGENSQAPARPNAGPLVPKPRSKQKSAQNNPAALKPNTSENKFAALKPSELQNKPVLKASAAQNNPELTRPNVSAHKPTAIKPNIAQSKPVVQKPNVPRNKPNLPPKLPDKGVVGTKNPRNSPTTDVERATAANVKAIKSLFEGR